MKFILNILKQINFLISDFWLGLVWFIGDWLCIAWPGDALTMAGIEFSDDNSVCNRLANGSVIQWLGSGFGNWI